MVFLICILILFLVWFAFDDWRVRREFRAFSRWIEALEEGAEESPAFDEKERSKAQSICAPITCGRENSLKKRKRPKGLLPIFPIKQRHRSPI